MEVYAEDPQYLELSNNLEVIHSLMKRLLQPDEGLDDGWIAETLLHAWEGLSLLKSFVEIGLDGGSEDYVSMNQAFSYPMDFILKIFRAVLVDRPELGSNLREITRLYIDQFMSLLYGEEDG